MTTQHTMAEVVISLANPYTVSTRDLALAYHARHWENATDTFSHNNEQVIEARPNDRQVPLGLALGLLALGAELSGSTQHCSVYGTDAESRLLFLRRATEYGYRDLMSLAEDHDAGEKFVEALDWEIRQADTLTKNRVLGELVSGNMLTSDGTIIPLICQNGIIMANDDPHASETNLLAQAIHAVDQYNERVIREADQNESQNLKPVYMVGVYENLGSSARRLRLINLAISLGLETAMSLGSL